MNEKWTFLLGRERQRERGGEIHVIVLEQCDQMSRLFFKIWPFSTMKLCL